MAGPAPKNRDWHARENAHKPKGLHLIVTGLVEVPDADRSPVLTKGSGGAAKVLACDLAIKACKDPGIKVPVWKQAYLHEEVSRGQYERVSIRWDGKEIANVEVIDDREHHAAMDKMSDALDAKYAKKAPAKPKPAKKAAKKSAPKKAKKPAKKASKSKKPAKKAAKKSALRKMVSRIVKKLTPTKKAKKKGGR
jgi:hypothetical protein